MAQRTFERGKDCENVWAESCCKKDQSRNPKPCQISRASTLCTAGGKGIKRVTKRILIQGKTQAPKGASIEEASVWGLEAEDRNGQMEICWGKKGIKLLWFL